MKKTLEKFRNEVDEKQKLGEKVKYGEKNIYDAINKLDDLENIIVEIIEQQKKSSDVVSKKTVDFLYVASRLKHDLCELLIHIVY